MKILMLHKFFYIEGGAERYVFNLTDLLRKKGDTVIPFAMHHPKNVLSPYDPYFVSFFNPEQLHESRNPYKIAQKAARVIYNVEAQKKVAQLIEQTTPDIAHVHSLYHHITPSVLSTLKKYKIPVIQTLHDFKLLCPNIVFLDGRNRVCDLCQHGHFWHATVKRCFRQSLAGSLLVTAEAMVHKYLKSYKKYVDLFHAPSAFLANRISQCGYGHRPVRVLPYTLDVAAYVPYFGASDYFVYAGRLSVEKGVMLLLEAMERIKGIDLYLIGTGPLEDEIRARIDSSRLYNVRLLGYKSGDELRNVMSHALFTVSPSLCHDNSPLAIYESQALGNAVIGSKMGGIPELVHDGVDGLIFNSGSVQDLCQKIRQLAENPGQAKEMGKRGRATVERLHSFDAHYIKIMNLYAETINYSR
jgi:glycosyltransferase involved in cell wall biosynthesis